MNYSPISSTIRLRSILTTMLRLLVGCSYTRLLYTLQMVLRKCPGTDLSRVPACIQQRCPLTSWLPGWRGTQWCHDIMWWWHSDTSSAWSEQQFWKTMVPEIELPFYQFLPMAKVSLYMQHVAEKHYDLGARIINEINTFARWKVERLSWPEPFVSPKLQHIFLWLFECTSVWKDNNPKFHNAHTGWGCTLHSEICFLKLFACFLLNSLELPRHLQAMFSKKGHQISAMTSADVAWCGSWRYRFLGSLQCLQLFDEKLISDGGDPKPVCLNEHPGSPMTGYVLGHMFFSFDSTCGWSFGCSKNTEHFLTRFWHSNSTWISDCNPKLVTNQLGRS